MPFPRADPLASALIEHVEDVHVRDLLQRPGRAGRVEDSEARGTGQHLEEHGGRPAGIPFAQQLHAGAPDAGDHVLLAVEPDPLAGLESAHGCRAPGKRRGAVLGDGHASSALVHTVDIGSSGRLQSVIRSPVHSRW